MPTVFSPCSSRYLRIKISMRWQVQHQRQSWFGLLDKYNDNDNDSDNEKTTTTTTTTGYNLMQVLTTLGTQGCGFIRSEGSPASSLRETLDVKKMSFTNFLNLPIMVNLRFFFVITISGWLEFFWFLSTIEFILVWTSCLVVLGGFLYIWRYGLDGVLHAGLGSTQYPVGTCRNWWCRRGSRGLTGCPPLQIFKL